jgi:hypothetical protein
MRRFSRRSSVARSVRVAPTLPSTSTAPRLASLTTTTTAPTSSSTDGDYDDDDDGVFVDEHEHVGSSNPDEAWPCYAIAVVDGVWRERDLRAIATMHNPPTRRETMRMLASWIDNAAHPHGRAMSLFLAALLHCVAAHRAGATQARVRLADASRVLPAGIGGAHRCRVCGNQYPTSRPISRRICSDVTRRPRRRRRRLPLVRRRTTQRSRRCARSA